MAKLNTSNLVNNRKDAVKTTGDRVLNHEGNLSFERDAKSELFITSISTLNEDTFYESAVERRSRIEELVEKVSEDQEWLNGLIGYLRKELGLKTVPSIIAVEAVHARLAKGLTGGNRNLIDSAILRVDETAELLAYWLHKYGKNIPSAVKRGLGDSLNRTLNEYSYLKWNGRTKRGSVSLRDVINLVHPNPKDSHQSALYSAVLDTAYGNKADVRKLPLVKARKDFLNLSKDEKIEALTGSDAALNIRKAGLTHEVIAGELGVIPSEIWENLIPNMGYMALRMNLRRIHESGVSDETIDKINKVLKDGENVRKSMTMPIDFLSAYRNAPLDFASALQRGANHVLDNIPELPGKTLILVDHSYSMSSPLSDRSSLTCSDAANVFASALYLKSENPTLVAYDNNYRVLNATSKDLLRLADSLPRPSGGTETKKAVEGSYKDHDRIIVITDEQDHYFWGSMSSRDVFENIPEHVYCYTWNLVGYKSSHTENSSRRVTFGGLSDKGFKIMPLVERGNNTKFPWEN